MHEYKIEKCYVKDGEAIMNKLGKEGWRVVAVTPNVAMGYGLIITFERKLEE